MTEPIVDHSQVDPVLVKLSRQWAKVNNRNLYLLYRYHLINPLFLTDRCERGGPNLKGYQDQKSLLDMLVNRLMSHGRNNGGKKALVHRALKTEFTRVFGSDQTISWRLALALAYSTPDRSVRSSRYGSGVLTRAVWNTFPRRINWFIYNLTRMPKSKSFARRIVQEINLVLSGSVKSYLLTLKRQSDSSAALANLL